MSSLEEIRYWSNRVRDTENKLTQAIDDPSHWLVVGYSMRSLRSYLDVRNNRIALTFKYLLHWVYDDE